LFVSSFGLFGLWWGMGGGGGEHMGWGKQIFNNLHH